MCPGGWGSLGFFMSNCSSGHLMLPVLYRRPTASTIQETRLLAIMAHIGTHPLLMVVSVVQMKISHVARVELGFKPRLSDSKHNNLHPAASD